tara:strand:- start:3659 stop:4624 length:966 start_codon:yes stop_codon:yes gene_type:complete
MKKIFINNLLIILIFFFIFEIFLRSFDLADLRGHGEELLKKQKNTETTVFGKKVFLDEYGYRVPYKNFLYNDSSDKIVFIGDSVLFGSGVNEEETFVGKLRKSKREISFINASIIGNDVSDILNDIKKNNILFNAKSFFIILTLDDISISGEKVENTKENNSTNKSFFEKLKNNYFLSKINLFLRSRSYTYIWIKGIFTKPSERYFFESFNYYKEKNKINFFKDNILKIYEASRVNNFKINFFILPYEYQVRNNCSDEFLLPQNKIVEIFDKENIEYTNLTQYFCTHDNPVKLYLNFDPVHLSIKGHDLVFHKINELLNKN